MICGTTNGAVDPRTDGTPGWWVWPYCAWITGAGLSYLVEKLLFFYQPLDVEWRASTIEYGVNHRWENLNLCQPMPEWICSQFLFLLLHPFIGGIAQNNCKWFVLGPEWLMAKIWLPKFRRIKILVAIWFGIKICQYLTNGMPNLWLIFLPKF